MNSIWHLGALRRSEASFHPLMSSVLLLRYNRASAVTFPHRSCCFGWRPRFSLLSVSCHLYIGECSQAVHFVWPTVCKMWVLGFIILIIWHIPVVSQFFAVWAGDVLESLMLFTMLLLVVNVSCLVAKTLIVQFFSLMFFFLASLANLVNFKKYRQF